MENEKMTRPAPKFTEEVVDNILMLSDAGITATKIADLLGVGASSTSTCIRINNAARSGDTTELRRYVDKYLGLLTLLCGKYNIDIEKVKEQPQPEPVKPLEPIPMNDDREFKVLASIRDEIHAQNELITQFMDTVIPHWMKELQKDHNANFDSLHNELLAMAQMLEKIKYNTKK